ncbi:MAG: CpsD/CapB family tyrosine-protein kinase [Clostridia bacterium]|nr:CpsD/CapB family tyrosine-protein kinase [Clostridia bacterium]
MQTKVTVKHIKSKSFAESEAYKKLRTNIQFSGKDIRTIAFTSTCPNEGKSEISYRAAYSMAAMGKKTIYVDSDLRNSTFVSKMVEDFKGELKGLVHCLVGENTLDEIIVQTQVPNLDFIAIGAIPPNPSELLSQEVFTDIIAELKERYDYVIIDTSPAGFVVDGVVSCAAADGVIYVVSSGDIGAKAAKNTIAELGNAGCRLIGCVLNKINTKDYNEYGYGYGFGYGYSGAYAGKFAENNKKRNIFSTLLKKKGK